jgi:hypothetical protein
MRLASPLEARKVVMLQPRHCVQQHARSNAATAAAAWEGWGSRRAPPQNRLRGFSCKNCDDLEFSLLRVEINFRSRWYS